MIRKFAFACLFLFPAAAWAQGDRPDDAQIAHIAYAAGAIDVAAGQQALVKSTNPEVKEFAEEMVRDHRAVNDKALALIQKLGVVPKDNPTSQALAKAAGAKTTELAKLSGPAFDRAYIQNEIAFHKTVNNALESTLIPDARNAELKALLQTGLVLFRSHQRHAEHLAALYK